MFTRIASRFCRDTQTSAWLLERLTADEDTENVVDLMDRLALMYEITVPPVPQGRSDGA